MAATAAQEAAIEAMVRRFYDLGLADAVLGPIFRGAIHDWAPHVRVVADFWSHSLHGTGRYQRNAFAPHQRLAFGVEAFAHWLSAFEQAAAECLDPADAANAIRIARHMAKSYEAGLFPFRDAEGRPLRIPAAPRPGWKAI